MKFEGGASNATGLAADVEDELVEDEEDDADAVLAVRCGIGIRVGRGEDGAGDVAGEVTGVAFAPAGKTRAMSPFGNLVGTSCKPVPLAFVKKIPFDCCTWIRGVASTCGRMCT